MSSVYIGVKEVRGQVPGTTCNGARTNSAINNSQNSGYARAPEYYAVHWGSGAPGLQHQAPRAVVPVLQRQYQDATCWRHNTFDFSQYIFSTQQPHISERLLVLNLNDFSRFPLHFNTIILLYITELIHVLLYNISFVRCRLAACSIL